MTDAVELARIAEVPSAAGDLLKEVIDRATANWEDEPLETSSWYHDQPIWFVIEPKPRGSLYRVLQISVVRADGRLWFELALHRESRSDETLSVPERAQVQRLPLERASADQVEDAARRLWLGAVDPSDPDAPGLIEVPLSPSLRK